jgi:hypothetical protein
MVAVWGCCGRAGIVPAGTRGIVLATLLAPALALAASAALVEQKLRLLEGYFNSETAARIQDGGNRQAMDALSRARGLVVEARDTLSAGDTGRAATLADEALRAFSAASRLRRQPTGDSGPQRTRYNELRDTMHAFRDTLARTRGGAGLDRRALDAELARADRLAAGGYLDRANTLLAEVYQGAMQAISEARASETVIYRLEFESPDDELAYERERFRGNELLLEMLQEGGASENAKRLAGTFADQARARRDQALSLATRGDVTGAIAAMEEAGSLLGRALRTLGLPFAP